jgi:hypothetical protein
LIGIKELVVQRQTDSYNENDESIKKMFDSLEYNLFFNTEWEIILASGNKTCAFMIRMKSHNQKVHFIKAAH